MQQAEQFIHLQIRLFFRTDILWQSFEVPLTGKIHLKVNDQGELILRIAVI
jgi:hypothetical protein